MVREITEQIWNLRRIERMFRILRARVCYGLPTVRKEKGGHDAIRGMVERAFSAFPDYHEEIQQLIAEGECVVVRLTISGTQRGYWSLVPPTGACPSGH